MADDHIRNNYPPPSRAQGILQIELFSFFLSIWDSVRKT